jgi:hypothetical protein
LQRAKVEAAHKKRRRVDQLRQHIDAFVETYNEDAEPFAWTTSKPRGNPSKMRATRPKSI